MWQLSRLKYFESMAGEKSTHIWPILGYNALRRVFWRENNKCDIEDLLRVKKHRVVPYLGLYVGKGMLNQHAWAQCCTEWIAYEFKEKEAQEEVEEKIDP